MARNYDNYGYEKEYKTNGISISKKILIILMILVAILLILYLLKGCTDKQNNVTPSNNTPSIVPSTKPNNTSNDDTKNKSNDNTNNKSSDDSKKSNTFDYEKELLEAGKEYYKLHSEELPDKTNECAVIELVYLMEEKLVDSNKFGSCNVNTTYVEACRLKNKKIEYNAWVTCVNKKSEDDYAKK